MKTTTDAGCVPNYNAPLSVYPDTSAGANTLSRQKYDRARAPVITARPLRTRRAARRRGSEQTWPMHMRV